MERSVAAPKRGRPQVQGFSGSALQRGLLILVALKLVGVVLVFDPLGAQAFPLAKTLWSRSFEWALAGLLVAALVRHGLALVPRTPLLGLVGVLAAVHGAAALMAADRYLAVYGDTDRYLGLAFFADMLVLAAAVAVAARTRRDWAFLAAPATVATLAALVYVLVQYLGRDPIVWSADGQARIIGTFGNPGPLGTFLAVVVGAGLGVALFGREREAPPRAAALGCAALALLALVPVESRSSFLGVVAVVVALPVLSLRAGVQPGRKVALGSAAFLVVATAALLVGGTPLGTRLLTTVQGGQMSDRVLVYTTLVASVADRPLLGWGPDNVGPAFVAHRTPAAEALMHSDQNNNAHSWPLQAAVTTGLAGLVALLVLIGATLRALWRARATEPVVANSLLLAGVAYWVSELTAVGAPSTGWIPWVIVGGAVALETRAVPPPARASKPFTASYVVLVALALLVGGTVVSWPALVADRAQLASRAALEARRTDLAIQRGRESVRADPGRAEHWAALGQAAYAAASYREAGDAFAEAAARAPHLSAWWVNLAVSRMLLAQSGDLTRGGPAAAFAAAERATAADPNSAPAHKILADVASRFGRPDLALVEVLAASHLDPTDSDLDAIAARAAGSVDLGVARTALEQLLAARESRVLLVALADTCVRQHENVCARNAALRMLAIEPTDAEALGLLRQAER